MGSRITDTTPEQRRMGSTRTHKTFERRHRMGLTNNIRNPRKQMIGAKIANETQEKHRMRSIKTHEALNLRRMNPPKNENRWKQKTGSKTIDKTPETKTGCAQT